MIAVMLQQWLKLTFLHWRYPAGEIAATLPRGLEVDTFDGSAWLGLVPFSLEKWRAPATLPVPWLSHFPETNLRTYVRARDGAIGVWFYSLDAARAAAVLGARALFGLPYRWAQMSVRADTSAVRYESRRHWPERPARTSIEIRPGGPLVKDELAVFLAERYRLYSTIAGQLTYTPIEHPPWPLQSAEIVRLEQDITAAAGFGIPKDHPVLHFTEGVEARIGMPRMAVPAKA